MLIARTSGIGQYGRTGRVYVPHVQDGMRRALKEYTKALCRLTRSCHMPYRQLISLVMSSELMPFSDAARAFPWLGENVRGVDSRSQHLMTLGHMERPVNRRRISFSGRGVFSGRAPRHDRPPHAWGTSAITMGGRGWHHRRTRRDAPGTARGLSVHTVWQVVRPLHWHSGGRALAPATVHS